MKKQNEVKDSLIGQLNTDLKELKNNQLDHIREMNNLNILHKKAVDEWKHKLY